MELKYFSQHYKIVLTGDEDWFDPRMSLDTTLYIDPFMVFKSKNPLFANAKNKFFDFFKAAFELAHEAIFSELAYKKLEIIFKFPEVKEICLGVSKKGTSGSGSGGGGSKNFAEAFVKLAKAGHKDIKHFEEVEIFTEGIGADKISDATANIIKLELIEYTRNICKKLNVPTFHCAIKNSSFDFEDKSWDDRIFSLPTNPFFDKGQRGVILVPKEFLRAFQAIGSDGFAGYITGKKNEELRAYLNYDLDKELKKDDLSKKMIVDLAEKRPDLIRKYVKHIEENEADIEPYNLEVDKKNLYRNEKKASEFILVNPLTLSASDEQEFIKFLEILVQQCKLFIEEKEGCKLLWDALKQLPEASVQHHPRTESEAQNLLAEIILGYCQANSLKISKEPDICKKAINLNFTSGYKGKALIKLQLVKNIPVKDSLKKLLADVRVSGASYNYYLFVAYTEQELERAGTILKQIESMDFNDVGFKLLIVNATLEQSIGERSIAQELLPNPDLEPPPVSLANNPQKDINQLQKILILAAIPHSLRLDKEIREIEEAITRAINRDLFKIRIRTAVRPQDIRRAIAEEQPQIVHFCGHGLEDGSLLLEDDGGNNKPVAPEGLASLFKLHADYVNCVLLNACHSEQTAVAISQYINYAIGMNQPIEDKAAIAFAQGFYDGLGYKNSGNQDLFQRAFDEGMVAILMENVSQGSIPVLKKKL